jgi:hypothetical protein
MGSSILSIAPSLFSRYIRSAVSIAGEGTTASRWRIKQVNDVPHFPVLWQLYLKEKYGRFPISIR